MRISSLCCGRADVRLDGLTNGLNVLYGSPNSVKADLRNDVYTVLFGPPVGRESISTGGWIELTDGSRQVRVSRHREAGLFGSLNIEGDRHASADRWLSELTPEQFNAIFSVHFGDARSIGALADAAQRFGYREERQIDDKFIAEVEQRLSLDYPERSFDHQLVSLESQRRRLTADIEACETNCRTSVYDNAAEQSHVERRITDVEETIQRRSDELVETDHAIAELEPPLYEPTEPAPNWRSAIEADSVRALDAQIARLRHLQNDLSQRLATARDELATHPEAFQSPRVVLRRLEGQIGDIENELSREYPYHDRYRAHARGRVESMLTDIRNGLYDLCQELSRTEIDVRFDSIEDEVVQLESFRMSLARQTDQLIADRNALVDELEKFDDRFLSRTREEYVNCQCEFHSRNSVMKRHDSACTCTCNHCRTQYDLRTADHWRTFNALQSTRRELISQLDSLRAELTELNERRRELILSARPITIGPEADELRRELARVDAEIHSIHCMQSERTGARRVLDVLRSMREVESTNVVLDEASQWMERLTHGTLQRLQSHDDGHTVWASDKFGKQFSYEQLSLSSRDQVKLALAMACSAESDRRGLSAPLMLEDVFVHIEGEQMQTALETLNDFCSSGRQVLLLTTLGRVAGEARDLGVPVRSLQYGEYEYHVHGAGYRPVARAVAESTGAVRRREADRWTFEADENRRRRSTAWEASNDDNNSYGIGIYDESASSRSTVDRNGCHLSISDRITDAPFLEFVVARKLESLGIITVGDLMKANAEMLADRLPTEWEPQTRIRNWQSQASLMCDIPGIRSYDSRILVASGIRNARQIEELDPVELHRRVESFIETSEGKRLTLSGSDEEIARFRRWLDYARQSSTTRRNRTKSEIAQRASSTNGSRSSSGSSRSSSNSSRSSSSSSRSSSNSTRSNSNSRQSSRSSMSGAVREGRRQRATEERTTEPRFYLSRSDDVEQAPSIGSRTAERLAKVGIHTVDDLLNCDPVRIAARLKVRHIKAETIREWQEQASLVCRVPELRGHDAQFMVACGVNSVEELTATSASELFHLVDAFCDTKSGQRILRNGKRPTVEEASDWIRYGKQARSLAAA